MDGLFWSGYWCAPAIGFHANVYKHSAACLKKTTPAKMVMIFFPFQKLVTNENMGSDNTFNDTDLADLKKQPGIDGISPLIANQFRVKASAGTYHSLSVLIFFSKVLTMILLIRCLRRLPGNQAINSSYHFFF